jgi:hypothetical protein
MNVYRNFAVEMIGFLGTGKTDHHLTNAQSSVGDYRLRVVVINLLNWLKRESQQTKPRALSLSSDNEWCNVLKMLIKDDAGFRSLFVLNNNSVELSPAISEAEVREITTMCAAAYNPPLMD